MNETARWSTLLVKTLMTADPVVIHIDTAALEIAETLAQADISGAPVVDGSGFLVGVVSQTDLVRVAATRSGRGDGWQGMTARHMMTRSPVTVREDTSVAEAARRMERHGIHRVIVLDEDGAKPVGVISMSDLLPLLVDEAVD
ncbi:MAG: CBS domain-containing protein [Chloroflexota bacterium]